LDELDIEETLENLYQCRRCGICREAVYENQGFDGICPVWRNSAGFETDFMRGRIQVAIALLEGELEKTKENAESLYTCTLCGNCSQICSAEFEPAKTLERVRHILRDIPNETHEHIAERILEHGTPYDFTKNPKRDWLKEVGFEIPISGEILYFTGCTAPSKISSVVVSTARILKAAGIDFGVLENEPCCGSVLLRTGRREAAIENTELLVKQIAEAGASRLVVSCAGCLRTLRNDLSDSLDIEVFHVIEFIDNMINDGSLNPKPLNKALKVVYHDPCHLGRELGVYEAPRSILQSIPNLELVEWDPNREQSLCCGAGGGVRSYDSELSIEMAKDRVKMAMDLGVDVISTACPFCELNLESGVQELNSDIQVVDVLELLDEALHSTQ
jgi:Fe-S oxidoreductase